LSLVEDLDGRWRGPHFHRLPRQRIGHAVEAALELDVIVDVHGGLRPHGQIKALGGQRPQNGLLDFQEQAAT